MFWLALWALVTLGFVFLARDATITDPVRIWIFGRTNALARFVTKLLECAPCVAAWSSLPAAALVAGAWYFTDEARFVCMLVSAPVAAVGLLYGLTVLSPSQAVATLGRMLGKVK